MRLIAIIVLSIFMSQAVLAEEKVAPEEDFSAAVTAAAEKEKENPLLKNFLKLKSSSIKYQFEFICGFNAFKFEKSIFSGASIYWHTGLGWEEMKQLNIKSRGISFEGLGSKGGVPKNRLNIKLSLPLYNIVPGYASSLDYFTLRENSTFVPYGYHIDFYSKEFVKRNITEITDFLELDLSTYIKNQRSVNTDNALAAPPAVDSKDSSSEALNWEQRKKKAGAAQADRDAAIREAIKGYNKPTKAITKVYGYSNTSYCRLKE